MTEKRLTDRDYLGLLENVGALLESARHASARTVNALMTATYCEMGRRIVEFEQRGFPRAAYGKGLISRLSADLTKRFGRGFGPVNLSQMKKFYLAWPTAKIFQTLSEKSPSRVQTASRKSSSASSFPLPWSHYGLLLRLRSNETRGFYETDALRGGWSVRQLQRQIDSQFYERTALSRDKAKMLTRGTRARPDDAVTADEEVKDPPRPRIPRTEGRVHGQLVH